MHSLPAALKAINLCLILSILSVCCVGDIFANGLNRNGVGAVSSAKGGAAITNVNDGFAAMSVNPALLGIAEDRELWIGLTGAIAEGSFLSGNGNSGSLINNSGLMGEIALKVPLNDRFGFGLAVIPDSSRMADWQYLDEPGGIDGGTSYGVRKHRSEIMAVRVAAGLGFQVTDRLSLGASLGGVYNRNQLESPYIFQSHPALAGFKTLLDMETDGWGINGEFGLSFQVTERVMFGLSYRTPTEITSDGVATGDLSSQFTSLGITGVDSTFRYDAEVENELPQSISAGFGVQVFERTRMDFQLDWIDWGGSFDSLPVHLTNGTNATVNGLLGTDGIDDTVPLEWEDRFVSRVGIEHLLTDELAVRAGYSYGKSPVPSNTRLPMTAAISEHTLSTGIGWNRGPWSLNLSYQYDLPATSRVGDSDILSGEYDNSRVKLDAHWVSISAGFRF